MWSGQLSILTKQERLTFSLISDDRMESEASELKKKLDQMSTLLKLPKGGHDNASETTNDATIEVSSELDLALWSK